MPTVIIIDDKDHALQQVLHEFPPGQRAACTFQHFASLRAFRAAAPGPAFLVFLDFFLDGDADYGASLIPELVCEHLVCFSSMQAMSDHMCALAQEGGQGRIGRAYAVQKEKASLENPRLRALLAEIFGEK